MRTTPKVAVASIAALLALAGCGSAVTTGTSSPAATAPGSTAPRSTAAPSTAAPSTVAPTSSVLGVTEQRDLVLVQEQERAGLDAYSLFATRYPSQPIFANLAGSQETQLATVRAMATRFGLADPSGGLPAGTYRDPTVQQLYDSTVGAATSAEHAIDAIEHFEQQHLRTLQTARSDTTRADLLTMYANLEQASSSHLSACSDALAHLGAQG